MARMVESARDLNPDDPGWCLEEAGTGDELDDLGRAFNDLLSRLHVAYQRQRRFSSDASHQLRTPLTVLIGQIEVALRQERSGEEYRRVLKSALGRAVQLGQIVEALLFLGRADSDAQLPDGRAPGPGSLGCRIPGCSARDSLLGRIRPPSGEGRAALGPGPSPVARSIARQLAGQRLQVRQTGFSDRRRDPSGPRCRDPRRRGRGSRNPRGGSSSGLRAFLSLGIRPTTECTWGGFGAGRRPSHRGGIRRYRVRAE